MIENYAFIADVDKLLIIDLMANFEVINTIILPGKIVSNLDI